MAKITLLDDANVTLYCHPEFGIIHHIIHKFVRGESFRTLMTKGADAFIEHKCTKWLSDDRSSAILTPEDVEWGQAHWENRILEKGWKYWALVMPQKMAGQIQTKELIERYAGKGVTVRTFPTSEEGFAWLKSL